MFLYDVTMIMPNGDQVTERVRAEDEGYAARQAAAKWGFKTWHESTKNRVAIRRRIPIGLIPTGGVSVAPGMRSRPKRASQMNAEAPASRQVPHTSWCSPRTGVIGRFVRTITLRADPRPGITHGFWPDTG